MPVVTIALVIANVVAYLLEIRHGGSFFGGPSPHTAVSYGAIPYELAHPGRHCALVAHAAAGGSASRVVCQGRPGLSGPVPSQPASWITVLTSMFLHGSFLHLFPNMLFLAIFGPAVEDATSRPRFLAFYLLGGLLALALQVAVSPNSTAPTIGSSGPIAAVLGGYIVLYPRARILSLVFIIFLFTIVAVPALVLLAAWFAEQLLIWLVGLASPVGGSEGVAYFAHIGSFLLGALAIRGFASRRAGEAEAHPGGVRFS